jgi:hypothetical protein
MLKYMSNHCKMFNIMNKLCRWKIEHKYYADVIAQLQKWFLSFVKVWQTQSALKMLFVQTMHSRSLAGKCRMSLLFTVDGMASFLFFMFSSYDHSPP